LKAQRDYSDKERVLDQFIITITNKMEQWTDEKENVTEMLDEEIGTLTQNKRPAEESAFGEFERDEDRIVLTAIDTNQNST